MARAERAAVLPAEPLTAFRFDDHAYTFSDVLIAGALCGEWTPFIARARRRQWLADEPAAIDPELVAQEVVGFRRARRLEAASDLRTWLEQRSLAEDDLVRHARALAREQAGAVPPPGDPGRSGPANEVDWWPDAVLSGDIERWAATLERWVIADDLHGAAGRVVSDPAGPEGDDAAAIRGCGVLDVAAGADEQRIGMLVRACLGYRAWAASAVDDAAVGRLIRRKRLDWTWLAYDTVTFNSESAAWEAALCVREDGERLEDVAARAGVAAVHRSGRQENLPPAEGSILMALAPGEVGGPAMADGEPILLMLKQALPPAAHDDEIRRMARAELISTMLAKATAGRTRREGTW